MLKLHVTHCNATVEQLTAAKYAARPFRAVVRSLSGEVLFKQRFATETEAANACIAAAEKLESAHV